MKCTLKTVKQGIHADCISFVHVVFTGTLPSSKETIKGNIKTVTEYKIDEDGKKFKVTALFLQRNKFCFSNRQPSDG